MAKWSDYADMGAATIADADTFIVRDVSDTTLAATGTQKEYPWSVLKTDISTAIFAALNADNITIDGNTISTISGNLNLTPVAGSNITLDGTITVDAGVVTGITSLGVTGTRVTAGFMTDLTVTNAIAGSVTGTAATVTGAAQTNVTSLGTLTALTVDNLGVDGNTISSSSGNINVTPVAGSNITLDGTVTVDAGVVAGITSLTATGAALGGSAAAVTVKLPGGAGVITDETGVGVIITGLSSGEQVYAGNCVFLNSSNAWMVANAAEAAHFPARGMAISDANSAAVDVLVVGIYRHDTTWAYTAGQTLYLHETTGDNVGPTATAPSTSGDVVQVVGFALSDDEIFVNFTGHWLVVA